MGPMQLNDREISWVVLIQGGYKCRKIPELKEYLRGTSRYDGDKSKEYMNERNSVSKLPDSWGLTCHARNFGISQRL